MCGNSRPGSSRKIEPESILPYGDGHIHETYLVKGFGDSPGYILQKINRYVFKDVPGMMQNIEAVTGHLRKKLRATPGHDPDREALRIVPGRAGRTWIEDSEGDAWRMYHLIPDCLPAAAMDPGLLARDAGFMLGRFQAMLADLETPLIETIPDFHNIHPRGEKFREALRLDPEQRAALMKFEIDFVLGHLPLMMHYYDQVVRYSRIRPVHYDTKLNNFLFGHDRKPFCLIDLDTVMPGYPQFDYGDALRTMANTSAEDEENLEKVGFNWEISRKFTSGYSDAASGMLSREEMMLFPFSPAYMAFLIGLRFLTDFLEGDPYYRIHYPGHNATRARVQFKLVREIERVISWGVA